MRVPALLAIVTAVLVAGCATARSAPAAGGEGTLVVKGRERTYSVTPGGGESAPLVILLHGGGGNGRSVAAASGFAEKARAVGFALALPDGTGRLPDRYTWNAGGCCAYAMQEGVDDVAFLSALIDRLVAEKIADPRRVYLAGMSNGGMLAHRAAARLSGKVAGAGIVVGGMFGGEAAPSGPTPVILFNGVQDQVVPFAGGASPNALVARSQSSPFMPADYAATYWAKANGCSATPEVTGGGGVAIWRYQACSSGDEVVFYRLTNAGHAWPGGRPSAEAPAQPTQDINATDVMWDFFKSRTLRQ